MAKLEKRVYIELEQWPDHAVLNDVSLQYLFLNNLKFIKQINFLFYLVDYINQAN